MKIEVIAEWGQPHDLSTALAQTEAARKISATYAKWQIVDPERLASTDAERYWDESLGGSESQRETFDRAGALTEREWGVVAETCGSLGVEFLATPFDLEAVELLEGLGVSAYKIASGDINYRPLIERIAQTGKRVFLSTGAATPHEIERALRWLKKCPVVPLACDLVYPCPAESADLARTIRALRRRVRWVGYSDHTREVVTGAVAVTLGATVLEKHVTLDPNGEAPDDAMALTVEEASQYRALAEQASILIAEVKGDPQEAARTQARRSAHAAHDLPADHVLSADDVKWLRPALSGSVPPTQRIRGRTLVHAVAEGERIALDDLA